jgi:GxxExxY protein
MEPRNPEDKHKDLTEQIIGCFYKVYNTLGYGFPEKIYENAMVIELRQRGLQVDQQPKIKVYYEGELVGEFEADLIVVDAVIVELKAVDQLLPKYEAQLLGYLKSTLYEVGLLLNFGPRPRIDRKIYDNERKGSLKWLKP